MIKATLSKATIIGYVGRDPDVRISQSGKRVVSFPVVTNADWRDARGQRCSKPVWHNVVVYHESVAHIAAKFLKKGSRVYLEGSLENRRWIRKDGQPENTVTELVLSGFNARLVVLDDPPETSLPTQTEVPIDDLADAPAPLSIARSRARFGDDLPDAPDAPDAEPGKIDAGLQRFLGMPDDHARSVRRDAGDDRRTA
jgi:single-strand DNA-binding protein